jgi:hypothetical protein
VSGLSGTPWEATIGAGAAAAAVAELGAAPAGLTSIELPMPERMKRSETEIALNRVLLNVFFM